LDVGAAFAATFGILVALVYLTSFLALGAATAVGFF
jgi:hypothetical protein